MHAIFHTQKQKEKTLREDPTSLLDLNTVAGFRLAVAMVSLSFAVAMYNAFRPTDTNTAENTGKSGESGDSAVAEQNTKKGTNERDAERKNNTRDTKPKDKTKIQTKASHHHAPTVAKPVSTPHVPNKKDSDWHVPKARVAALVSTLASWRSQHKHIVNNANRQMDRWITSYNKRKKPQPVKVGVIEADWGVAAWQLTREWGSQFVVLNMANAFTFGGGYVRGAPAQEENMFRRTNLHFSIKKEQVTSKHEEPLPTLHSNPVNDMIPIRYNKETQDRIEGKAEDKLVYLNPEIAYCFVGPELTDNGRTTEHFYEKMPPS
eukprot:3936328-Rhodomonas_salina.1